MVKPLLCFQFVFRKYCSHLFNVLHAKEERSAVLVLSLC